jgi:hypothetical protein
LIQLGEDFLLISANVRHQKASQTDIDGEQHHCRNQRSPKYFAQFIEVAVFQVWALALFGLRFERLC